MSQDIEEEYRETMSDSDSCASSTASDTSVGIQDRLEEFSNYIEALHDEIQAIEHRMECLQRPVRDLHVDQLGDVPFLQSSPFRSQTFRFKHALPGIDMDKRYAFHEITAMIRTYLFEQGAVQPDGSIHLTPALQTLFGISASTTTFMNILKHLPHIVS